jgi:hypothetical protein
MARRPRRNHSPAFKAKVAEAARSSFWRPNSEAGIWTLPTAPAFRNKPHSPANVDLPFWMGLQRAPSASPNRFSERKHRRRIPGARIAADGRYNGSFRASLRPGNPAPCDSRHSEAAESYPLDSTDRISSFPQGVAFIPWTLPTRNLDSADRKRVIHWIPPTYTKSKTKRFSNSSVGKVQVDDGKSFRQAERQDKKTKADQWATFTTSS